MEETIKWGTIEKNSKGLKEIGSFKDKIKDWQFMVTLSKVMIKYKEWETLANQQQKALQNKYKEHLKTKLVMSPNGQPMENYYLENPYDKQEEKELEEIRNSDFDWPFKPTSISILKEVEGISAEILADLVNLNILSYDK